MDVILAVNTIHAPCIEEYQQYENVDRPLLGEPEAKFEATDADRIELLNQQDPEAERNGKPDTQADRHEAQICPPIGQAFVVDHIPTDIVMVVRRSVAGRRLCSQRPSVIKRIACDAQTKKSGFLRNRFFKPTLARGSWPPESPAKPYLKVSFVSVVAEVLLKGYVYRYRNSQKTRLLSILYTGYKADYR